MEEKIHESASGLHAVMEKIKSLPLPDEVKDWNRTLLIQIDGAERNSFEWIIKDGHWQIEEGQPHKPDLIVFGSEVELIKSFTSSTGTFQMKRHGTATPWKLKDARMFGKLRGAIIKHFNGDSPELLEAAQKNEKKIKSQEYETTAQSVSRVSTWLFRSLVSLGAFLLITYWINDGLDETILIAVAIVVPAAIVIKIIIEAIRYRRYHNSDPEE